MTTSSWTNETIDQELSLDELNAINGAGFFSDQFDLIVDYWLGDVIDDLTHSIDRVEKQTGEGSDCSGCSCSGDNSGDNSTGVWAGPDGKGCLDLPF